MIGDVPAVGLCGSALVDTAAELLRHGVLTREGRLMQSAAAPAGLLSDLRNRLVQQDGKAAFLLASGAESGTGRAVLLTQRDFRELQLASGAIKAGIEILLKRAGLQPANLDAVLVAGGFGNFIRRKNAQRIGLLPDRVPRNRIRYQGNTSLAGSRMIALSRDSAERGGRGRPPNGTCRSVLRSRLRTAPLPKRCSSRKRKVPSVRRNRGSHRPGSNSDSQW